jgi:hypothetical protein
LHGELTALPQPHLRAVWQAIGFALLGIAWTFRARSSHYFPFTNHPPSLPMWMHGALPKMKACGKPRRWRAFTGFRQILRRRLAEIIADPGQGRAIAQQAWTLSDILQGDEDRFLGASRVKSALENARKSLSRLRDEDVDRRFLDQVEADLAALTILLRPQTRPTRRCACLVRSGHLRDRPAARTNSAVASLDRPDLTPLVETWTGSRYTHSDLAARRKCGDD